MKKGIKKMGIDIDGLKAYTLYDLSKTLDVTLTTLRKYVRIGELKARKVGRRYVVSHESLKEFLNGSYRTIKKRKKK